MQILFIFVELLEAVSHSPESRQATEVGELPVAVQLAATRAAKQVLQAQPTSIVPSVHPALPNSALAHIRSSYAPRVVRVCDRQQLTHIISFRQHHWPHRRIMTRLWRHASQDITD
jgi:hypothetical protein